MTNHDDDEGSGDHPPIRLRIPPLCKPDVQENGGYSLRQQLSSPTESTLLPMYMDGSDG